MNVVDRIKEARQRKKLEKHPIRHWIMGQVVREKNGIYNRDNLDSAEVIVTTSIYGPKYKYELDKETFPLIERAIELEKRYSDSGLVTWLDRLTEYAEKYAKEHEGEIKDFREKYPNEYIPLERMPLDQRNETNEQLKKDVEKAEENTFELGCFRLSDRLDLHLDVDYLSIVYREGEQKIHVKRVQSYCADVDCTDGYHSVNDKAYPMDDETKKLVASFRDAKSKKDKKQISGRLHDYVVQVREEERLQQYSYYRRRDSDTR